MNGRDTNYIYALDIGTRKVAGILLGNAAEAPEIVDAVVLEQGVGSMEDGQIHDISGVSNVIKEVTQKIENQRGLKLTSAAVAAAGRALRTQLGTASLEVSPLDPIDQELIHSLEMEAVMDARNQLRQQNRTSFTVGPNPYMFVAYSVTKYDLDGDRIASLVGQRGNRIGVEVIATFLPRVVVDSLSASLAAAGLKMSSLTLEPIAALHVAIPPSMRALNLALVDVGAGTSTSPSPKISPSSPMEWSLRQAMKLPPDYGAIPPGFSRSGAGKKAAGSDRGNEFVDVLGLTHSYRPRSSAEKLPSGEPIGGATGPGNPEAQP